MVGAPEIVGTNDLLNNIAYAAFATYYGGDVAADLLDIGAGIGRADRNANFLKDRQIGHIVAHVENLVVSETILVAPLLVGSQFGALTHEDVGDAETFVAFANGFLTTTSYDGNLETEFNGELEYVAVLDVGSAHGHAIGRHGLCLFRKDTVDVESKSFDMGQQLLEILVHLLLG